MPAQDGQSQVDTPNDPVGRVIVDAYRQVLDYLFFSTAAVVAALIVLIFFPGLIYASFGWKSAPISIFLLVIMAGTLGAFFSALLRLYEVKNLPAVLYEGAVSLDRGSLFIYTLTPALIGGIAAAILYLVFQSGLLQGSPFPAMGCPDAGRPAAENSCVGLGALLGSYGPKTPADFARAILWGFIAGFAERLVPDLLGNLAQSDALKKISASARTAAVAGGKPGGAGLDETAAPAFSETDALTPRIASRGMANTLQG